MIFSGTVDLDWAFSDSPNNSQKIVCDVLPTCSYDLIFGSQFLTVTQTLTKWKRRLTECVFSMVNVLQMNFLGADHQRLQGYVGAADGAEIPVLALPDTGAECNIISSRYGQVS